MKNNYENSETAYFAWGCFWCIEWIMNSQKWVYEAISWYAWWDKETANYETVSTWKTKHRETVKVIYDPTIINYKELCKIFFRQIDPLDEFWQFADRWFHYTTAIYYTSENQKEIAEKLISDLNNSWEFEIPIFTVLEKFTTFFEAEESHQNYWEKESLRYNNYKIGSGRARYIENSDKKYKKAFLNKNLKEILTPIQYNVTQEAWTEKPFMNEYWNNKEEWIYVDIVDWTPLFSSKDKYDSGSGWPSFTKPISEDILDKKIDKKLFSLRTEVLSSSTWNHLWHVFPDWPIDKWWFRYCINSASLKFIPKEKLKENGYNIDL